jgi:hypothetical protein
MKDRRVDVGGQGGSIKFNGSKGNVTSWYLTQNQQVRLNFYTEAGYDGSKINKNHKTCSQRGYMMDKKDWRYIEGTVYIFHKGGSGDDEYVLYYHGGTHTGSGNCEGCAYKADLSFSGRVRVAKEQWHVSYVFQDWKDAGTGDIEDKWVGFKFVVYEVERSGKENAVKLEIYIDDSDGQNKWELKYEYLDAGGWGDSGGHCGGKADQILNFGGPNATLRVDNSSGFNFKFLSIREMDPKGDFAPPPDPGSGGGGTGGGGGSGGGTGTDPEDDNLPPAIPQSNVLTKRFETLWNINFDKGDSCTVGGPIEDKDPVPLEDHPINPTENYVQMPTVRTRVAWLARLDISQIQNERIRQAKATIKKFGSPTGTLKCRIRKAVLPDSSGAKMDEGDGSVIAEIGTLDVALLTTDDTEMTFTNLSNTVPIPKDGKVSFEFETGNATNYIMVKIAADDPYDGPATILTRYSKSTGWEDIKSFDMAGSLWI